MESVTAILKAVEARNFELAQRTAEREAAKNTESDLYLSLAVYTSGLVLDRAAVQRYAELACPRASPKTTRMFLNPTLCKFGFKDLLMQAFGHGNRVAPQDADHVADWVQSALQFGDLAACQKALMASLKLNKKPRLTTYSLCLVMALCDAQKPNQVFKQLCPRMIEKYLPAETPEECYVVCLVRAMHGPESAVEYLANADLFTESSLDLQLIYLDKLLQLKAYDQIFSYAQTQIKRIDSYNYFQALNTAAVALNKPNEAREFCKQFQGCNSQLALLDLAQKEGADVTPWLVSYWSKFKAKPSTFEYLKPFIQASHLDVIEAVELPELVNKYKLKRFLGLPTSVEELYTVYTEFDHKLDEKTDYFIGTDLLLLAADVLVAEHAANKNKYGREQAAAILQYSLKTDPLNFETKVRLIHIFRSLNCFSLAFDIYTELRIQNIQQDTLGHLISTRIGSTAPEFVKKARKLETNRPNLEKTGLYAQTALEMGAFTKFSGILELGVQLTTNTGLCLLDLEKVKSERLVRGTPRVSELATWQNTKFADVRDFTTVENLCPVGPKQTEKYARVYCEFELLAKQKMVKQFEFECEELTECEKWQIQVIQQLCSALEPPKPPAPPAVVDWRFYHWCYTLLDTAKLGSYVSPAYDSARLKTAVSEAVETAKTSVDSYVAEAQKSIAFGDATVVQRVKKAHKQALQSINT